MSLMKCIKEECGGDYCTFLSNVAKPRAAFLSAETCKAMQGFGCNKTIINEGTNIHR